MATEAAVPKLRFPEFRNFGKWSYRNGDQLFGPVDRRPATPGLPILAITQEHGAIARSDIDYHVSVTDSSVQSYKEVQPGDFIISLRSFQGGIEYSRVHGICSPAYVILRPAKNVNEDFYRFLFKSERFITQLNRNIEGIRDGKMISFKQFSEQLLPDPDDDEQKKIAECLGSLDDLIEAEGRKLEALRRHKKGLLQQLFPRPERTENGETIPAETAPRLRFPEFSNSGDWSERTFGELYRFAPTNTFSRDQLNYECGAVRNIHYGDIHKHFQPSFDLLRERVPYVNWEVLSSLSRRDVLCEEGDLVFADASEDLADVGKCIEIVHLHGEPVVAGTHTLLAKRIDSSLIVGFGAHLFQSSHVRSAIQNEAQGTKVLGISPGRLSKIVVRFPKDHSEQAQIVNLLCSLDALVLTQAKKIELLKTHKRGLMQGLFPVLEDVSA